MISKFFKNHLDTLKRSGKSSDKIMKTAELFADLEINNNQDYLIAVNISNILYASNQKIDKEILKIAFNGKDRYTLNNINDYYFLVFDTMINNSKINKRAYPNFMGFSQDDDSHPFDLNKWGKLVHKIYDAVYSGDMEFDNAVDYYANTLDLKSEEDLKFKKWINYYKDGEHLKYNSQEGAMEKQAYYQFNPSDIDFYSSEPKQPGGAGLDDEMDKARKGVELKTGYEEWKQKLNSAIRRVDKLLRHSDQYVDPDTYETIFNALRDFDIQIGRIRLQSTASDLTYRIANQFKKMGFDEGSDVFLKVAQEAAAPPPTPEPVPAAAPAKPAPQVEAPAEGDPEAEIPVKPKVEPVPLENIKTPGPETGEYDFIGQDVTLEMAADKLTDIASRLADRRTIRLLAEFDIMLDQLGVASMFPELSESQSKLIDAYSYALTRVTRMMGMISQGRGMVESKMNEGETEEAIPGAATPEATPTAPTEPTPEVGNKAIKEEFTG